MSNTATVSVPVTLTAEETKRAIEAAESALEAVLPKYGEPAGGDEYGGWPATEYSIDEESEVSLVDEECIEVECHVGRWCDGDHAGDLYVTVKLNRQFKVTSDGMDAALTSECEYYAAEARTYAAETGNRSAMD